MSTRLLHTFELVVCSAVQPFRSEVGETPLHKAAQTSSVAVVKLLLDEGAEVNPRTEAKVSNTHEN